MGMFRHQQLTIVEFDYYKFVELFNYWVQQGFTPFGKKTLDDGDLYKFTEHDVTFYKARMYKRSEKND